MCDFENPKKFQKLHVNFLTILGFLYRQKEEKRRGTKEYMLKVEGCVSENFYKEHFQHSINVLIDETCDMFRTPTSTQMPDSPKKLYIYFVQSLTATIHIKILCFEFH